MCVCVCVCVCVCMCVCVLCGEMATIENVCWGGGGGKRDGDRRLEL